MVDRVQTSEINKQCRIWWCSAKSLLSLFYLKWQKEQSFIQTVRRGSWCGSVQCCTKWLVLVTVCVCMCVCVCVWVCGCVAVWVAVAVAVAVAVVGGGSEFSGAWCKRGEGRGGGARTGGSSASWQPDGWSCPSVCWSWPGDSAVSSLMVADWRSCVSGGWDHLAMQRALRVRRVL